ncbi:MAG: hypothetical protein JXR84_27400 [Anaerolineae bacterium]|nr:hypothetical protein [Anaerolineae bacterium]
MIPDLDSTKNILALHASCAYNEDGALLFLGPSGTGKSAMLRLLSPYMEVFAEDKVYITPQSNGRWKVVKGDAYLPISLVASTEEDLAVSPSVPLRAIFRLYQAPEPKLESVEPVTRCRYLTSAFFEVFYWPGESLTVKRRAFVSLASIARDIPGYAFYFDLSPRTPDILSNAMGLR